MKKYDSSYDSSISSESNLSDHSSDYGTVKGLTSSLEICSHRKVGKHRFEFNVFNTNKMTTRWISTEKLERHANGILQEYVKDHNLILKNINLHEQLRRKRVTKLFVKKKSKKLRN